ncbi:class I SAM-dependent methyltransferase [Psychromonas ossibalaenae]|uniref:class I SAM-dependent methyltransferase n=1 Tax=Psychromonas ossibalaenae TaxID=444922 RepID=UPI00037060B8|nr:class I SAM-dependent methyltransferase [Psychromonas ossibalaenae]
MIIKKEWRILTVGDGDLSFSSALLKHHHPAYLTATVYDSLETMKDKYGDQFYQELKSRNNPVLFGFDVTNPRSWGALKKNSFDLIIFQFPLLPAFRSFDEYKSRGKDVNINTLNRRLLRSFLINSFSHFLDPKGQQLCFITSKDVKPYREWNIENDLHLHTDIHYLGSTAFDINMFPGYRIRNVDRDKHVKDTKGITYVWSQNVNNDLVEELQEALYQWDNCCTACRAGPFSTHSDRLEHNQSKKHLNMMEFKRLWLADLKNER